MKISYFIIEDNIRDYIKTCAIIRNELVNVFWYDDRKYCIYLESSPLTRLLIWLKRKQFVKV